MEKFTLFTGFQNQQLQTKDQKILKLFDKSLKKYVKK